MKHCPECGTKITFGAKFCNKCGKEIKNSDFNKFKKNLKIPFEVFNPIPSFNTGSKEKYKEREVHHIQKNTLGTFFRVVIWLVIIGIALFLLLNFINDSSNGRSYQSSSQRSTYKDCQDMCETYAEQKSPGVYIRNLEGSNSRIEGCCWCNGYYIDNDNILRNWGGEICA